MSNDNPFYPDDDQTARLLAAGFTTPLNWTSLSVSQCLEAARVLVLNAKQDHPVTTFHQTINPRNEAAALSFLISHQLAVCGGHSGDRWAELQKLCNSYSQRTHGPPPQPPGIDCGQETSEGMLSRWAAEQGLQGALAAAIFNNGLRGLKATHDLKPGDCVLSVPAKLLISIKTLHESDMGSVLEGGLDEDSAMLIFTMIDRHDPDSDFAHFWASLPSSFHTGLSVPESDLEPLASTAAFPEIMQARQHVRDAYDAVAPALAALAQRYPSIVKAQHTTWEDYLWAAELWYSYGLQVKFGDGAVHSCLVPVASLMNHSPWPHVVHYSKLDVVEQRLKLSTFRSCAAGEQCLLSYGPMPNLHLLLFYGFCLEDNPHDSFAVSIEMPDDELSDLRSAALEAHGLTCSADLPESGPLPPPLLGALRIASATEEELEGLTESTSSLQAALSQESDELAFSMLEGLLQQLSEPYLSYSPPHDIHSLQGFPKYVDIYLRSTARLFQNALSEAAKLKAQMHA